MKYLIICIAFMMVYVSSFAQLKYFPILIGSSDEQINSYLDSINNLKSNPYVKVEKKVASDGSLVFENGFALGDEPFYKCITVFFLFRRVSQIEICVSETISGRAENAEANLAFMKDNYTYESSNKWIKPWNNTFQLEANFETKDNNSYSIKYNLIEKEP